mmetsp:Transcript_20734/g.28965  ORF Transcript_20734/g.28965 Transcript_20734/m.28965 type:complete len:466 (+) Transcript_20734:381-1778(+)
MSEEIGEEEADIKLADLKIDGDDDEGNANNVADLDSIPDRERPQVDLGDAHPKQRMHWAPTGLLTVGMIMGTGVLALPAAVAGLGYVLGLFLCLSFGTFAGYLGTILGLTRVRFHPKATSYASLATKTIGPRFGVLTKHAILINWWTVLPLYLLTAIESLRNAFYWSDICYSEWGLVIMVVLILPVQMRSYHSISWLVAVSDFAVIVIIAAILIVLGTEGQNTREGFTHHIGPPPGTFLSRYNNVSAFLFAYQGQSVFLEIMAEMRDHREWPKALWLGQGIMIPTYVITAAVGYYLLGDSVPGFLPAALPNNGSKTFINLLLAFHVLVAYLVHNQPLCQGIEMSLDPSGVPASNLRHFAISATLLFSAWLVANLIPFFSELVGILGAAFGSPILLFYPPIFFLRGMASKGRPVAWYHRLLCNFSLWVLFPFTFIVGIVAAFHELAERWRDEGSPFDCHVGSRGAA